VDYRGAPADAEVGLTRSYGPDWRHSSRKAVARLEALGVYELATAQDAFMRSRR
jgi:hypothetical protein